jgi:hypothetical protein
MYCANPSCPDFERTGRHGNYEPEITHCPKCGAELVAELPVPQPPTSEPAGDEPTEIVSEYRNRQEAALAAGFLESHGVPALVSRADATGIYPVVGFAGGYRLLVPASQAAEARSLLGQIGPGRGELEDLVPVMACGDRGEAESAIEYLEFQGIPAAALIHDSDSLLTGVEAASEVRVGVRAQDHDRAVEYLEEAGFFAGDETD